MTAPDIKYTERQLPHLDQATLDFIFKGVYGRDLAAVEDERFRDFLDVLYRLQDFNYQYRFNAYAELFPLFEETVGPMERNSEGTSLWLALGLALKEWYGLSHRTLKELLSLVTVRL